MTGTTAEIPPSADAPPIDSDSGALPAGLVTRGIAFVVDVALISLVAVIVAAAGALLVSFFRLPTGVQTVLKVIAAGLSVLWAVGYFVGFWAAASGQTPGNRVMEIRVQTADGQRVRPRRGVVRFVGLVVAALPLFAGFIPIIFDRRRRGLQDYLARTVVVETPDQSLAEARQARLRQAYEAARAAPRDERFESASVTR